MHLVVLTSNTIESPPSSHIFYLLQQLAIFFASISNSPTQKESLQCSMKSQKCKNKVEMWTSKLGKMYNKNEVDFNATAAELDRIRNIPENRRCADCGMQGTVWSSVNLGVFTCMRCGSFHRALGTHISKVSILSRS